MSVMSAISSNIGKKKVNQDALLTMTGKIKRKEEEEDFFLALVCDGMGGMVAGEKASKSLTCAIRAWAKKDLIFLLKTGLTEDTLKGSLNESIRKTEEEIQNKYGRSGTTMALLLLFSDAAFTVNVGDSRVFCLRKEDVIPLTEDQSLVQMLINRGELEEADRNRHPQRSRLLQCVGVGDPASPVYRKYKREEGDAFLLCSDGFWHHIKKEEMLSLFLSRTKEDLERKLKEACQLAIERGEKDNISVIACCEGGAYGI